MNSDQPIRTLRLLPIEVLHSLRTAEPFSTAYSRNNFVCVINMLRTATEFSIASILNSASLLQMKYTSCIGERVTRITNDEPVKNRIEKNTRRRKQIIK